MDGLAEGDVLADRYLLGSVVGHGAMGEVHLAEDLRLARPVAIKSLRPELARYPDVRQRFGQEARSAARISHPNVVRVYDTGEQGDIPYLVMECLPGTSLVDELAWGTLEPRRARRVGLDVLGALDAAHRLGVVHRDVKPGNILLSATLDGPVKVSDFGIAKSADDHSVTDSGALVGTPAYLAPERVAGEPAGAASDLYSLGVVLFEALSGRRPYEGETALALALAIHMGDGPSLVELRPDLDPELAAIVERALARDPSQRWESAGAMAEALRAWRPRAAGRGRAAGEGGAGPVAVGSPATPTVALAPGDLPVGAAAAPSGRADDAIATAAPDGDGVELDDGTARSRRLRRRRTGVLLSVGAGLVWVVRLGVTAFRSPGRATPGSPPTSPVPLAEAPIPPPPPESSVPPSSAPTTRRAARRPRTPSTTAAPATRPATTRRPTATRRRTTTIPATTAPTTPPTVPPTTAAPAVTG